MFNTAYHKLIREIFANTTRCNICEFSDKIYAKALSTEILRLALKRSGMLTLICLDSLLLAEVLNNDENGVLSDSNGSDTRTINQTQYN